MPEFKIRAKTETYYTQIITAKSKKAALKRAVNLSPEEFTDGKVGHDYDAWSIDHEVERVSNNTRVTVTITEEVVYEVHRIVDLDQETMEAAQERIVDEWLGDGEKPIAAVTERNSTIELTDDES